MTFPGIFPISFFKSGSGIIQSIQAFELTIATGSTTGTATITAVNTANSVIWWAGQATNETTSGNTCFGSATLTNSTTVTGTRNTSDATDTVTIRGTVVEFVSSAIVSVQYGTITIASLSTSNTATLGTSITTANSVVFYLGTRFGTTTSGPNNTQASLVITNSTTITAERGNTTNSLVVGFCVVEFNASVFQSIQPRSVTLTSNQQSDTDTITGVTTANTILIYNGINTTNTAWTNCLYRNTLTNGTTVTLTRTGTTTTTRTIKYTVLEFKSGIISNIQRGTTSLTGVASNDTTITAVANTAKTLLSWSGFNANTSNIDQAFSTAKLLNSTTVRAEKNTTTNNAVVGWEAVEFV